jgi:hypothetical protein
MRKLEAYTVPKVASSETLRAIATEAGGYTVTSGIGGWVNDAGQLIEEPQVTITILAEYDRTMALRRIIVDAARAAGEDSVLIVETEVSAKFYGLR